MNIDELAWTEETLVREGNDLMKICRQIYSHTPQILEYAFEYEEVPSGHEANLVRIINILRLYLELLLEFLNLSPKVSSAFRKNRAVCTPILSVPALAYTVWTRLKFLTSDNIKNELNKISEECDRGVMSSESQTYVLSLATCESCHLSQKVVRELVSKVEFFCSTHEITESSVLSVKDDLQNKVHDMTNWETMSEWCKALTTDIEQLTEITDKVLSNWKAERLKEKKRYDELEKTLKNSEINKDNENKKPTNGVEFDIQEGNLNQLKTETEQKSKIIHELERIVQHHEENNEELDRKNQKLLSETVQKFEEVQYLRKVIKESGITYSEKPTSLNKEHIEESEDKLNEFTSVTSSIPVNELEISRYRKIIRDLESKIVKNQVSFEKQKTYLEAYKKQIEILKFNESSLIEKLNQYKELNKKLESEINEKNILEQLIKEQTTHLEMKVSNLNKECNDLKFELQKHDSYNSTIVDKRGYK